VTLDDDRQVGPGEEALFDAALIAPTLPGSYAMQWQVVRDTGEPFGVADVAHLE